MDIILKILLLPHSLLLSIDMILHARSPLLKHMDYELQSSSDAKSRIDCRCFIVHPARVSVSAMERKSTHAPDVIQGLDLIIQ